MVHERISPLTAHDWVVALVWRVIIPIVRINRRVKSVECLIGENNNILLE
jgi:hypothetical protein